MARPRKSIAPDQVRKLARLGATVREIADFLDTDPSTLYRRFATDLDKGRTDLKLKLRRLQLRAAERGNTSVLIWLGKCILQQKENGFEEKSKIEVIISNTEDEDRDSQSNDATDIDRVGAQL